MKERPILMTPENAQKCHDGTKTQTRRIVKRTDSGRVKMSGSSKNWHIDDPDAIQACPYGVVGDRLWVREHVFVPPHITDRMWREGADTWPNVMYRAEMNGTDLEFCKENKWKSKPSIFMKRWACRTVVEIIEILVERVQDISEEDALAEGVMPDDDTRWNPIQAYECLWESIHGKGSWERNDWVWAITFKVVR